MLALAIGTLLVVVALAFVLYPLVFAPAGPSTRPSFSRAATRTPDGGEDAIVALREIEFDRATGKLSDADYADLKTRYTQRALDAMRASGAAAADAPVEDAVEAAVLAYRARLRSCARCGPRPEPDAIYCSNCGAYLDEKCAGCGRVVEETGAAFCAGCGRQLAA
ncbi:MAG: zinc ribbon domain-containing protein [Gemmatimonadaceae bacterium]